MLKERAWTCRLPPASPLPPVLGIAPTCLLCWLDVAPCPMQQSASFSCAPSILGRVYKLRVPCLVLHRHCCTTLLPAPGRAHHATFGPGCSSRSCSAGPAVLLLPPGGAGSRTAPSAPPGGSALAAGVPGLVSSLPLAAGAVFVRKQHCGIPVWLRRMPALTLGAHCCTSMDADAALHQPDAAAVCTLARSQNAGCARGHGARSCLGAVLICARAQPSER